MVANVSSNSSTRLWRKIVITMSPQSDCQTRLNSFHLAIILILCNYPFINSKNFILVVVSFFLQTRIMFFFVFLLPFRLSSMKRINVKWLIRDKKKLLVWEGSGGCGRQKDNEVVVKEVVERPIECWMNQRAGKIHVPSTRTIASEHFDPLLTRWVSWLWKIFSNRAPARWRVQAGNTCRIYWRRGLCCLSTLIRR